MLLRLSPSARGICVQVLIDASNGASDYGNKFGEPMIAGYTRTFGQRLPNGERREWLKPIMFRCRLNQPFPTCADLSLSCSRSVRILSHKLRLHLSACVCGLHRTCRAELTVMRHHLASSIC